MPHSRLPAASMCVSPAWPIFMFDFFAQTEDEHKQLIALRHRSNSDPNQPQGFPTATQWMQLEGANCALSACGLLSLPQIAEPEAQQWAYSLRRTCTADSHAIGHDKAAYISLRCLAKGHQKGFIAAKW